MIIAFSPIRDASPLEIIRQGTTLILNDMPFDLEALVDVAPDSLHFAGPVTRQANGQLHVVLRLPHGANAPHARLFPADIIDPPEGPVALPARGAAD